MTIGIVTDRTLFEFARSSEGARFYPDSWDFIHARKGFLNASVEVPDGIAVLETPYFKGERNALAPLEMFIASKGIRFDEVLMIGDDRRDILAAAQCGMPAMKVDRYAPDFDLVRRCIERENSD